MPRATAARELLASREDVWQFIAEPGHFADWWPGVAAVVPDRRGFAEGARWTIHASDRPTLFRRSGYSGTLLITAIEQYRRFAFRLTGDRLDAELVLQQISPERTRVSLGISAAWLVSIPRSLPRRALTRLYNLCQTAAAL
jgi:uncharacterized protein YndB with AHSA1/START domain